MHAIPHTVALSVKQWFAQYLFIYTIYRASHLATTIHQMGAIMYFQTVFMLSQNQANYTTRLILLVQDRTIILFLNCMRFFLKYSFHFQLHHGNSFLLLFRL